MTGAFEFEDVFKIIGFPKAGKEPPSRKGRCTALQFED
jgi:hypothetical protein